MVSAAGPWRGCPPRMLGHTRLLILRDVLRGLTPTGFASRALCFVYDPCAYAATSAPIKMNVSRLRTVSPPASSLDFFHLIKIFIYRSNQSNVSWLYYCSDVEWLVAGWPCIWFYGLGQLWQQRGVATYCTPLSGFSWDDQRFSVRSIAPGKPSTFAICYVKTWIHKEGLKEINAWQEELSRFKRKTKLCEIQSGTEICNLGSDKWP